MRTLPHLLAVTALLAVSTLMSPAQAAPGLAPAAGAWDLGPGSDPLRTMAQAYLASYPGLTPEAAHAAARAQAAAGLALKTELADRWDRFGGGWFDPRTASYHLAVTDPATGRALVATGAEHGVTVHTPLVARSLDQLEAEVTALQAGTSRLSRAAAGRVGLDVATNRVLVAVPAGQVATLARQAPAGVTVIPATDVDVEPDACTSRADCDDLLASGLVIRNDLGLPVCSLGWTARYTAANRRLALTAGHCTTGFPQAWSVGDTTVRPIGTVLARLDFGRVDVGYIEVTNPFYTGDTFGRIYFGPPDVMVPNQGQRFFTLIGDVTCLSARFTDPAATGNPCGVVLSNNDPNVRNLVRIDGYDACPGDSGGGWYWLNGNAGNARVAVALHSRSADGCNSSLGVSWASPISAFPLQVLYEQS
jgi:streptogrisin C